MVDSRKHAPEYSAQTFAIQDRPDHEDSPAQDTRHEGRRLTRCAQSGRRFRATLVIRSRRGRSLPNRTLPQPGCEIDLTVVTTDPATGSQYTVYPGGSSPGGLQVVIKDASGKVVDTGTMEYG